MTTRRNLIANYLGAIWTALMGFIFVPVYLKFVGPSGYGLVGFFVTLSAVFALLDGGLGAAAIREAARFDAVDVAEQGTIRSLLRTMEVVFWSISIFCGAVIVLGAPLLVDYWLNVSADLRDDTILAIRWMALAIAIQFPLAFYTGCLTGFQKQVALNVFGSIGATVRSGGAALALWLIAPTMAVFFAWHTVTVACLLIAQRQLIASKLKEPAGGQRFSLGGLKTIKSFLGGVGAINVLSFLLTQTDKIILSKVLSLAEFGYYTLAWTLGTFIYRVTGPIFNVYYPRLIQFVARDSRSDLQATYRLSCTLMALVVVPFSLWLAFFGKDLLLLWTHNQVAAEAAAGALAMIALGTMCNAFMHMPYAMQLAHGLTKLALVQNVLTLIVIGPLTWYLATHYGLTAAAVPWLLVNASYVVISPWIMHRLLGLSGVMEWYFTGVLFPLLVAAPALVLAKLMWVPQHLSKLVLFCALSGVLLCSFGTSFFAVWPRLRAKH
jgi:O-antigen/teichoic acid export membrane protein